MGQKKKQKKSEYLYGAAQYTNKWLEEAISKEPEKWFEFIVDGMTLQLKPVSLPIEGNEYRLLSYEENREDFEMTIKYVARLVNNSPVRAYFSCDGGNIYLSCLGDIETLQMHLARAGQVFRK